jgi:hypothetical protein
MRNAVAPQAHRRHVRRLAFRRWQATRVGTPAIHPPEAASSVPDERDERTGDAWPRRAAKAVVDNVRAHPVAWLLGAAGVGVGCALLARVLRKRTNSGQAEPALEDESLALACRMDCAVLSTSELPTMPLGVQVVVTLVPLTPPV